MIQFQQMEASSKVFFEPVVCKYYLTTPVEWYGRSVKQLFTNPLEEEAIRAVLDIAWRLVALTALILLSPSLILTVPMALAGHAISCPLDQQKLELAQKTADEIRGHFNGLKKLDEKALSQIRGEIQQFESDFGVYRMLSNYNLNNMSTTFDLIDRVKTNLSQMEKAWDQWANFEQIKAGEDGVVAQPKDGNCWLHTAIFGLKLINHPEIAGYDYISLRPKIVQWMRENYPINLTLQRFVNLAIEAHKVVETAQLNEQRSSLKLALESGFVQSNELPDAIQRLEGQEKDIQAFGIDDYFNHMGKLGSHGSHAEFYAISELFKVNVAIFREIQLPNGPLQLSKEFDEQIQKPAYQNTIYAVLTFEGNHFNARLPE